MSIGVGEGQNTNVGEINNPTDKITGSATDQFSLTSTTSVNIGKRGTYTFLPFRVTFSQSVSNPYLFFTYLDPDSSFKFDQPFVLADSYSATSAGDTVSATSAADNTQNDGFVVRMAGTYSFLDFSYYDTSGNSQTVAFTAGVQAVPAPLPLIGAGVAFGFSRRLRRRIRA